MLDWAIGARHRLLACRLARRHGRRRFRRPARLSRARPRHAGDPALRRERSPTRGSSCPPAASPARTKPVIVIKAGRSERRRQGGACRTPARSPAPTPSTTPPSAAPACCASRRLRELFDAVETLAAGLRVAGDRLAILTNGGGVGVLATDAWSPTTAAGWPTLVARDTIAKLDAVLPPTWSRRQPGRHRRRRAGRAATRRRSTRCSRTASCDAILVMNCPTAVADSLEARARGGRDAAAQRPRMPVLTCWLGESAAAERARAVRRRRSCRPTRRPTRRCARSCISSHYRRNQDLLMETPPARSPHLCRAATARRRSAIVADVLGRAAARVLTEPEAKAVLAAYGIPVVETVVAADPGRGRAVGRRASAVPVALKILSPDITHKSDIGGVRLDLPLGRGGGAGRARDAAKAAHAQTPGAHSTGFTVQPMVDRPRRARADRRHRRGRDLRPGASCSARAAPRSRSSATGRSACRRSTCVLAREMIARTRVSRCSRAIATGRRPTSTRSPLTLVQLSQLARRPRRDRRARHQPAARRRQTACSRSTPASSSSRERRAPAPRHPALSSRARARDRHSHGGRCFRCARSGRRTSR